LWNLQPRGGIILDVSSTVWIIILVSLLTLLGSLSLLLITVKYYWGERGTPPLKGAERRRQKLEELRQRAAQIEFSRKNPRQPRSPDFLNNRKLPTQTHTNTKSRER